MFWLASDHLTFFILQFGLHPWIGCYLVGVIIFVHCLCSLMYFSWQVRFIVWFPSIILILWSFRPIFIILSSAIFIHFGRALLIIRWIRFLTSRSTIFVSISTSPFLLFSIMIVWWWGGFRRDKLFLNLPISVVYFDLSSVSTVFISLISLPLRIIILLRRYALLSCSFIIFISVFMMIWSVSCGHFFISKFLIYDCINYLLMIKWFRNIRANQICQLHHLIF